MHRERIDIAEIVMYEDIAETADFSPWNRRPQGLFLGGQQARGFGEGLQVSQCGIVENVVLPDVPSRLDALNLFDGVQNVLRIGNPVLAHNGMASRRMRSRMCGLSSCSGTRSTRLPNSSDN